ncbi:hypothetical protein CLAIMM_00583 isoform 2 [Cladophialophora immunda]|nr:hypothetical protein CLAIMM_00583 isoform 2 [Cladophialophora immunda]
MDQMGDTIEVVSRRRPQDDSQNRQLSVDQALKYTPMTMSILPARDCIPLPQLGCSNDSRLTSPSERQAVYRSELYTHAAKERLSVLLDPSRLSEIKFPRSPVQNENSVKPDLNPIQKMVLKMSKVDYTCHSSSAVSQRTAKKKTLQMPITKPASTVTIEIPKPPPFFHREDYINMQDTPKRRKLSDPSLRTKPALATISKKQKDDQLLASFENQLGEIFETRDQIDPDNSTERAKSTNAVFDWPDEEDDAEPRLAIALQERLQSIMSQLLNSDRLGDVSLECLRRLQRICEPAIESAQTVNLQIILDPSDEDISTWLSNLQKAESGATSACTLIYTVLGASQNEDLVNSEALQWLPNVLVNLFENCLIPISHSTTIAQDLSESVKDRPHFSLESLELVSSRGPFSIVLSYLGRKTGESLRTKSAKAYFLLKFSTLIYQVVTKPRDGDREVELDSKLTATVSAMLQQLSGSTEYNEAADDHTEVTDQEAQLAYTLSILNGPFCRLFPEIATTLSSSIDSDQAQVRTRSIKSVAAMLEIDSSLLDWVPTLADAVLKCASDDSSMVRDSALTLIAKFIMPRPVLQAKAFKVLLKCTMDPNVGVQKKAMAHLKDVYLREERHNLKQAIANEFLQRIADQESTVAELAKKILAEIWIDPQFPMLDSAAESAHLDVAIEDLKSHIVTCVETDIARLAPLLKEFLVWKLKDSKHIDQIRDLCARIVKKLLDAANGSEVGPAELTTLVAFVDARPEAVVPADLTSLKSYLKVVAKQDNIQKFKSVVAIFRLVLPHLSSTQAPLLQEVQMDLLRAGHKLLQREVVEEVMSCLRSIDGVLHDTIKIVRYTVSLIRNVLPAKIPQKSLEQETNLEELKPIRYRNTCLRLLGAVGKHIDLERFGGEFRKTFPAYKGGSVAGFIADCIWENTLKSYGTETRVRALESLGLVCQAWPGQFNKRCVRETFFEVLDGTSFSGLNKSDVERMQITVLEVFQELYGKRAAVKEDAKKGEGDGEIQALKNIGGDSKTREDDSAISTITNDLVDHLLRIAMSQTGTQALLAAQTLASIDHQGMTHPKQSTSAFVALETSTDSQVARVARIAHENLHQQHESVCEREYINAVFAAFRYQHEVFKDPQGGVVPGYTAKLAPAFAIISTSGSKYVKKFISNLVSKLNTEYSKLSVAENEPPEHLLFVLFVTQNLAFFEYKKMDELLHTVLQLELAFSRNGGETAQAIETHLGPAPVKHTGNEDSDLAATEPAPPAMDVDPATLKSVTTAACAITLISEVRNFLKRQYGISRDVKMAMQQNKQTKEAGREPVKVHGITGEKFWHKSNAVLESLGSTSAMIARCREFVDLVAVDDEVKIAEEEAAINAMMDVAPDQPTTAQRGRKRKSVSGSVGGTPKRPRGRTSKIGHTRRSASVSSSVEDNPDGDFEG